ncbi:Tat pathway signal sequence [Adlercreutzia sp. ZJ141]|uniref:Tat pathway signal sequence n=1 Tax=Adlercreutzia sp. ZJ141 TaxID=2709406 RepID=UPI001F1517F1|nr:Tat pathway signal sequence [Adlercreutzia sp. ZJ141]
MKQPSGFDALIEALKMSGMNVDFGADPDADGPRRAQTADGSGVGEQSRPFTASAGGKAPGDSGHTRRAGGGPGNPFDGMGVNIPFFDNMHTWGKRALIVFVILAIVVLAAAYWWFHPPINVHSVDTWTFVVVFIVLPCFIFLRMKSKTYERGTSKVEANPGKAKAFRVASFLPVAVVVVGVVGSLMSLALFPGNASKYANILQTDTLDFATDIQQVDYSEIPVIDRDSAILLGNREMGSIAEYVSQFEISPLYSQINYQSSPVRVSPLGYADLFKWFTNREQGIPAYSLVDMTTQDAEIVRLGDNPIHYSQSEPLVRNIDRHVQLKYPFYMFDEKSFEIDEDGRPWWICPVQTRTIGLFGGTTVNRVVMCDATTGECQDLAIDEVPQWVDRAYPANLLIQQYNWSGRYSNGWLNSWLGQSGVVQTTPGADGQLGYNYIAKDDDVWVYTGVTSATADNSIVGFVLVNQRTAESHFYSVSGATEESAMQSAEGQVQNLRYSATFPLLINVSNQPTYFMSLKDDAGLVKQFAMVDIQRYQNVAIGATVAECQKAYETLLATNGVAVDSETPIEGTTATGVIDHIAQAVVEGNSHFYVTLVGDDNIYDFAIPALIEVVGFKEGDEVSFTYVEGGTLCAVSEIISVKGRALADDTQASADGTPADDASADEQASGEGDASKDDAATVDV